MLESTTHTIARVLAIDTSNVEDVAFKDICTDSRKPMQGALFLALAGDNFDAHDYVDKAKSMGAAALIVSKQVESDLPTLLVKDTQQALTKLAKWHLNNIKPMSVAITGSNGKTTTKNLLFNILNSQAPTLKTQGNLNNHLGVPMTLLQLKQQHQYAVIEMGANHLGEIKYLREIVQPDIAIVTNTGDAHIGEFGGFDNLVKAKGEIYSSDSQNIVNTQTSFTGDMSFGKGGDIYADNITNNCFELHVFEDSTQICLKLIGRHNIENALAASACAHALGIDINTIKQGLEATQAEPGRLSLITTDKFTIIDDSYNANPFSITAAIQALQSFDTHKVIVLGDMAELGEDAINQHQQIGRLANQSCDNFYTIGELSKHYQGQHFDNLNDLSQHILSQHQGSTVLIKGSRIAQLDKLVTLLQK